MATGIDTSVFHDYRLDAQPDRSYKFYIDGVYKASGFGQAYSAPALIQLGDGTPTGSNAKAEIASFKFTQPDNVSGNIKGLQSKQFSILCENLTTGQSVTFVTATFDCQKSGLVVTPNDEINITTHGFAK